MQTCQAVIGLDGGREMLGEAAVLTCIEFYGAEQFTGKVDQHLSHSREPKRALCPPPPLPTLVPCQVSHALRASQTPPGFLNTAQETALNN